MNVSLVSESNEFSPSHFEQLVKDRYSCRAFLQKQIPRALIERILAIAQRSPSDCNIQPWKVAIVSGERLERLRVAMYERSMAGVPMAPDIPPIPQYTGVFQERRRVCGWSLYSTLGIERGDRAASYQQAMENFRFFGAPYLAIVTSHESLGTRGALDCGAYMASFLLAAQSLGVATVPQASIAQRADVIREQLGLPGDDHVVYGIAFGWPDGDHRVNSFRTPRAPLEEVVTFFN
ncbi:nitroreductase [Pseudomonas sp. A-R-19]|uniref:nitroreductase n=1 Tax=Pseudomonas sp. A-R-19 TaxID=2832403 RepID=UPI001CBFB835|nr:nitroreductase [Pseudomonas sp. A-R-19]